MANFTSNGVTFNNVKAGINTGGQKITKAPYKYDNDGNIIAPQSVINAIDIDWNQAQIPGIDEPIENTGALLAKVGQINTIIGLINQTLAGINDNLDNTITSEELAQTVESINESIQNLAENIGGTGEGSISERIDSITEAIELLQENIGGTGEGSINDRIDSINETISELQENIGGTGEGSLNDRVENNSSDIDEIKLQIQRILNGTDKINGHIEHVILTENEYNALEIKDPNTVYFITDEGESGEEEETWEDPVSTYAYINGQVSTNQNITLVPGRVYTIEGNVVGTITVDASNIDDPSVLENTELRLKNVKVISPENYGIRYITPEDNKGYKDLVITLEKNTKNYIVCTKELEENTEDQPGAIYSMNNLTIQGPGYLACHNSDGHGIRGTEVKLLNPYVYVDASHDAIHGKKLYICGGTYYIEKGNDVFGTGIGGTIKYAYGNIYVNVVNGKIFNAKSGEDEGVQKIGKVITIETPNIIGTNQAIQYTSSNITTIDSLYNSGTVKEYDTIESAKVFSGGTLVNDSTGMYIASKPFLTIEGLITKPINIPSTISDVTIYLSDAIIMTNQIVSGENLANEPSISYDATTSNIKIQTIKDTYNVIINNCPNLIEGQDADAVKSEHNIKVEIKNDSYLYINAKSGDGLDGTDVNITDSKGILMIHKCGERAIKGNNIIIGPAASTPQGSITLVTDPTSSDYTTFDGAVLATENCVIYGPKLIRVQSSKIAPGTGYADIFARKGKAMDKGSFIITANELNGIVVCNSLGATISLNMDNSANIYYNELLILDEVTKINVPTETTEQYIACPYKKSAIYKQ